MILGPVIPLQKLTVRRLWQTQLSVIFSLWFSKEKKKKVHFRYKEYCILSCHYQLKTQRGSVIWHVQR